MSYTSNGFTVDEIGFIQTAMTRVLAAVARGLDQNGVWVGFDQAAKIHNV